MQDYQTFLEDVKNGLADYYGEESKISIAKMQKNNDVNYYGITILNKNTNISTVIHMEGEFERYREEGVLSNVIKRVIQFQETHGANFSIDTAALSDYERMKGKLGYKLVNYSQNEARLKEIPHIRFLDLAVTFYCSMTHDRFGAASFDIQEKMLKEWGVNLATLKKDAKCNAPVIMPPEIKCIQDVVRHLADGEDIPLPEDGPDMFVLTNRQQYYGASTILYTDLLKEFAREKGSDIFILPSSVHEVILLPDRGLFHVPDMQDMVREINRTQLQKEEVLSDYIYYYNRGEDRVIRL